MFEWGSGASTIYYAQYLKANERKFEWHAVDNSRRWYQKVHGKIASAHMSHQVEIHCSEFPAFWELPGYTPEDPIPPKSYGDNGNVSTYVGLPEELGGGFDVMIVDGRFRRRCLEVAAGTVAPKGIVILHDAERTHYHSALSLYPHIQFLQTGVLPGTVHKCSITLCSMDDGALIYQMGEKYGPL